MSSKLLFAYYFILFYVGISLLCINVCNGKDDYDQIETTYKTSMEEEIIKAPLSFIPVCKPQQIHTFSQRQIRCACGVHCRYLCQTNKTETKDKKEEENEQKKTCKRVCRQKPCYRPLTHKIYNYRLASGLCRMWNICTYRAKCEGKTRRWVQYHLTSCQRSSTQSYYKQFWMRNK
ncbi:unnamed protein product [Heterobilharzia americana]|nr:unnamed protein product [Heterobilharzia americana]CAH8450340.1 unnamed protein product [Heterobilharzia americana]